MRVQAAARQAIEKKILGFCLSDGQAGRALNIKKSFIAFIKQFYTYFGTEAIKDSHLEGQIMQLRVVLLTMHYHANQRGPGRTPHLC